MKTRYNFFTIDSKLIILIIVLVLSIQEYGYGTETPRPASNSGSPTIEVEQELQVEDWMINLDKWKLDFKEDIAKEEELKVEAWMLSASSFIDTISPDEKQVEVEIEIADWMVDLNQW